MPDRLNRWPACVAGLAGGTMLGWVAGVRVLDPRDVGWVMRDDWQWHFLGWQFFRHENWQMPPGRIAGYFEPIGSAIAYTDSIPLVALPLKLFSSVLPNPLQYLGLWILLCCALQGFFGALLISTWTKRKAPQVLGGILLVLVPTLFARITHPALCAHWLLLWALWLHWREPAPPRRELADHAALGLASGLVHPYLAAMVALMVIAGAGRRLIAHGVARGVAALTPMVVSLAMMAAGWWLAGVFTLQPGADLQSAGLGTFSMNVLAPFNSIGRSEYFAALPVVSPVQEGEGFHYFGAGLLALCGLAMVVAVVTRAKPSTASLPLLLLLAACTAFAISPRVTLGDRVVLDLLGDSPGLSMFRSSARFFWPAEYALLAAAIGVIASRLNAWVVVLVLAAALTAQVTDLHRWYLNTHDGARLAEFHEAWKTPLTSPEWAELVRGRTRVRLVFPESCRGPAPVRLSEAAFLASTHGLALNDGFAARVDAGRWAAACAQFHEDLARGRVDPAALYLVAPPLVEAFTRHAGGSAPCRVIDGVTACAARGGAQ